MKETAGVGRTDGRLFTFFYCSEVGPLLRGELHLRPDDLQRDAVAVRRIRRLRDQRTNA